MQTRTFTSSGLRRMLFLSRCGVLLLAVLGISQPQMQAAEKHFFNEYKQVLAVSGTVTDEKEQPLEGVTVQIKGTRDAVKTDAQGRFTIDAEQGSILLISITGYAPAEIKVSDASVSVRLKEDTKILEEVYVGYQRVRKTDLTGAVSSVKASELNLGAPTVSQALVGKVAGVQISQVSGAPNSSHKIRVRCICSIYSSS